MSRSSNGSIIVNKPKSESVSLMSQFKKIESNLIQIKSSNVEIAAELENLKSEFNKSRDDLQTELNIVAVSFENDLKSNKFNIFLFKDTSAIGI